MSHQSINALLLTSPGCVHCAALKKILEKLSAEGLIDRLDIVDVVSQPDVASQYHVKSVPWLRLGPFEFQGAQRESELRDWIANLNTPEGITDYLKHLLAVGELNQVIHMVQRKPELFDILLALIIDEEKDMKVQLGLSAVFEEFEGSPQLQGIVEQLGDLSKHENPKIRADVAHYLSLSHSDAAIPFLQNLAQDSDREVHEIANDILSELDH